MRQGPREGLEVTGHTESKAERCRAGSLQCSSGLMEMRGVGQGWEKTPYVVGRAVGT